MPSKVKSSAAVEQNRESQRRSRARRKNLIESLSREVAEYKRQGVAASVEMQNAARAVSIENQRLRELLALRGVSQAEILQHLALPRQEALTAVAASRGTSKAVPPRPRNPPSRIHTPPSSVRGQSEAVTSDFSETYPSRQGSSSPSPGANHPTLTNSRSPDAPAPAVAAHRTADTRIVAAPSATHSREDKPAHSSRGAENCYSQSCGPETSDRSATHNAILPPVSDCFCPQDASEDKETEGLETSCDTAAEILIQLHRKPDQEQARVALGCVGKGPCSVKNTTIFKLMDEFS